MPKVYHQVLEKVNADQTSQEIADQLGVPIKQVEVFINSALEKYNKVEKVHGAKPQSPEWNTKTETDSKGPSGSDQDPVANHPYIYIGEKFNTYNRHTFKNSRTGEYVHVPNGVANVVFAIQGSTEPVNTSEIAKKVYGEEYDSLTESERKNASQKVYRSIRQLKELLPDAGLKVRTRKKIGFYFESTATNDADNH